MWSTTYDELVDAIASLNSDNLLFRGHSDATWPLVPGLGRLESSNHRFLEQSAYFDFLTRAGDLLPENSSSWNTLFAMQHFGLPTRLLDWTETLGVAIYFALRSGHGDAAVWLCNPFKLNEATLNRPEVIHPTDLAGTYEDYYIDKRKKLEGNVVAITPLRHNPRVFHQRAGFTLHDNIGASLEKLHPDVVKKVTIPADARNGAQQFLRVAGISEFSLFPDLDGLSRELKQQYFNLPPRKIT
jgi:hypothetical protein